MNRVLNHHQRYDGTREDRENQPTRDALVSISQLTNMRGKARRLKNSARRLFSIDVEPRYFRGFHHHLGGSITIVAFHVADGSTAKSRGVVRKPGPGLPGITVS